MFLPIQTESQLSTQIVNIQPVFSEDEDSRDASALVVPGWMRGYRAIYDRGKWYLQK